jgi:hypothetical protein
MAARYLQVLQAAALAYMVKARVVVVLALQQQVAVGLVFTLVEAEIPNDQIM